MKKVYGDGVALLAYHSSTTDPFYLFDSRYRVIDYYEVEYYPTAIFDGGSDWIVGATGAFNKFNTKYNEKMVVKTPGVLSLVVEYDPPSGDGMIIAKFHSVDEIRELNLHLRYGLTESHKYYLWADQDSLQFIVRDMLPDYQGVPISIDQGGTLVDSQSFHIDEEWVSHHCELVVFLQSDNGKKVLVSNLIPLYQKHVSGDANSDGVVTVSDVGFLSNYVFGGGAQPEPSASGDPNEDCVSDVQDVAYLIDYLFHQGPAPLRGWEID
ncbi:MAG: hypothetical protein JSV10_10840 [Candidatus Zixiibacteriota bacterium]|nr:MAG: hypothetical protein JSV10_10840 [candidate division Zixibacteria bacterium]